MNLFQPIQINRRNGNLIHVRPFSLLLFLVVLLGLAAYLGMVNAPSSEATLRQQLSHLEHEQSRLNSSLSETEALLSLRNSEVAELKQQLQQSRQEKINMQRKLGMFNDVLAARKISGVHFLRPKAEWNKEHDAIHYDLIVVKGDNYPRWIKGRLVFTVSGDKGESVRLLDSHGKDAIKIEMTTQAFMEGTLQWPYAWQPERLKVSLINHLGQKKAELQLDLNTGAEVSADELMATETEPDGSLNADADAETGIEPTSEEPPGPETEVTREPL